MQFTRYKFFSMKPRAKGKEELCPFPTATW